VQKRDRGLPAPSGPARRRHDFHSTGLPHFMEVSGEEGQHRAAPQNCGHPWAWFNRVIALDSSVLAVVQRSEASLPPTAHVG
jgi:hypothetical protein